MYGIGILKGFSVTLKHFFETFVDDLQWFGRRNGVETFQTKQSLKGKGMFTVPYPEEKIAVPERFRFIPFLVTYNNDDPEYAGKDWCTSCGICAKVCPPQCIWITQTKDATTGRPKPEPEAFYIDIDVCMNCGYCAEYCPFDAIKMDHDYELASYDRTGHHVYDKPKLSREIRYWESIAPNISAQEMAERGGYDHKDVQKLRGKAGLVKSRPGPISEKAPPPVAVAAPVAIAAPVVAEAAAPVIASVAPVAAAPAATTADGKVVVRRRGAGAAAPGATAAAPVTSAPIAAAPNAATPAPVQAPPAPVAPTPAVSAAPAAAAPAAAAPASDDAPPASGPKPRDPNAQVVVRRRNNPPPKKD